MIGRRLGGVALLAAGALALSACASYGGYGNNRVYSQGYGYGYGYPPSAGHGRGYYNTHRYAPRPSHQLRRGYGGGHRGGYGGGGHGRRGHH